MAKEHIKKVIEVEVFRCDICKELLKQNGDGTFLSREGREESSFKDDYAYTVHDACLIDLLDKKRTLAAPNDTTS